MPLVRVMQELAVARDLPAIQDVVRRAARRLTGADGATFVLRDGEECCYLDEDAIEPLWKGKRFPMRSCISGWSMLHRQAAVIADIYADPRIPAEAYRPTFVKSLAMVPIRSLDPIGAIGNYWATRHEATDAEIRMLQTLADATAVAMENVRIHGELEQQVRERTRELEAAREAAQRALDIANRANRAKSRFLAAASHDLRQPLQSLALLNGGLLRIAADTEVRDALAQQDLAIHTASRLVNALLDISKLESGAVRPEISDFPMAELIDELRQELGAVAARKGLAFEVESCREWVRSDPALLAQILRNLLANAIKYTPRGAVRLRCERTAAALNVQVLDTGIGIPADHLPHIFEEFYQVDAGTARSREGYGLGLSIVDRLVKLLDLKLDVRSETGRGSVFSLDLPVSAVTAAEARPHEDACAPASGRPHAAARRVLLVEDDKGVRDATRMLLRAEGYEVLAAASPEEAREQAGSERAPDLIISDYHLNCSETGVDIIAGLRSRYGGDLKAILVSGDTSPVIKGLAADEHTRIASKPVQAEQLLHLMDDLMRSRQGASSRADRGAA